MIGTMALMMMMIPYPILCQGHGFFCGFLENDPMIQFVFIQLIFYRPMFSCLTKESVMIT